MWRFIEEGPLLKFPLRESPFMAADPMYRDVTIAPPVRFSRVRYNPIESHNSFLSSHSSHMSDQHSSNTVEILTDLEEIPSIQHKTRQQTNSPHSFSSASSD